MVGIKEEQTVLDTTEPHLDLQVVNRTTVNSLDRLDESNLLSLSISQILSDERPTPMSGNAANNNLVFEYQYQDISPVNRPKPKPAVIDENSPPKKPQILPRQLPIHEGSPFKMKRRQN